MFSVLVGFSFSVSKKKKNNNCFNQIAKMWPGVGWTEDYTSY